MQEDVENKSVNLAVKSSKVTATVLYKGLRAFINHQKKKALEKLLFCTLDDVPLVRLNDGVSA